MDNKQSENTTFTKVFRVVALLGAVSSVYLLITGKNSPLLVFAAFSFIFAIVLVAIGTSTGSKVATIVTSVISALAVASGITAVYIEKTEHISINDLANSKYSSIFGKVIIIVIAICFIAAAIMCIKELVILKSTCKNEVEAEVLGNSDIQGDSISTGSFNRRTKASYTKYKFFYNSLDREITLNVVNKLPVGSKTSIYVNDECTKYYTKQSIKALAFGTIITVTGSIFSIAFLILVLAF